MTWYTDDRHLYHEQRRLDAEQAQALRKLEDGPVVRLTTDQLEGLCARLERELEDRKDEAWLMDGVAGTCFDRDPTNSLEWRERQKRRIAEVRAEIDRRASHP